VDREVLRALTREVFPLFEACQRSSGAEDQPINVSENTNIDIQHSSTA
jgi:hypothetical protein